MMNRLLAFLLFCVVGCAHKQPSSQSVHFAYAPELLEMIGRMPASKEVEVLAKDDNKSPRRVYFLTLYYQHQVLASHLGKSPDLSFCPAFHHDKVMADSYTVPEITMYKASTAPLEGRDFFPELAFGRKFSLKDYHSELTSEIQTLCEEGESDNYYKFDNLVTHYADKASFHSSKRAMESVLKIPIFANYYLIKMMGSDKKQAARFPEEKLFIRMTRTHWFDRYISEAAGKRMSYLSNKMVKR